jgi:predicted nucleic acid-binding Zn finger protein
MTTIKVESSNKSTSYDVSFNGEHWTCSCPHWMFRLKNSKTHCKHIEAVIRKTREYQATLAIIDKEFNDVEW